MRTGVVGIPPDDMGQVVMQKKMKGLKKMVRLKRMGRLRRMVRLKRVQKTVGDGKVGKVGKVERGWHYN